MNSKMLGVIAGGVPGEQTGMGAETAGVDPGTTHVHQIISEPNLQALSSEDLQSAARQQVCAGL